MTLLFERVLPSCVDRFTRYSRFFYLLLLRQLLVIGFYNKRSANDGITHSPLFPLATIPLRALLGSSWFRFVDLTGSSPSACWFGIEA